MDYRKIFSILLKILLSAVAIQVTVVHAVKLPQKMKNFEAPPSNYSDKRFNEWTWLTAHNSHLNWYDSSVLFMARNQELSIDDQLRNGVRGFMFDIDEHKCSSLDSLLGTCNCEGVCLCHGECSSNSIKDGFSMKSLSYAMRKLVNFLTRNKNEIITVFLEDYIVETCVLMDALNRTKNFANLLFNPFAPEWNVLEKGWPRISDMIKANKRLLIVEEEKRGFHVNKLNGLIRTRDFLIQNHFDWLADPRPNSSLIISSKIKLLHMLEQNYTKNLHNAKNKSSELNVSIPIARCFSVHRIGSRPNWDEERTLNLSAREHAGQLVNSEKLFLFNHFYGVPIKAAMEGNINVLEYINSKEMLFRRLHEQCDPNTNKKRPNYIALDFIGSRTFKELIEPLNYGNIYTK